MTYIAELPSCGKIYLPSFMKISTGVQAILFCLNSLNICNIGITDVKEL
jgi:hypothetical protein